MSKRQPNFTTEEVEVLLTCVESRQQILFGSFSSGLSAVVKDKNWEEVAESVSAVSGVKRSVGKVKKKWAGTLSVGTGFVR